MAYESSSQIHPDSPSLSPKISGFRFNSRQSHGGQIRGLDQVARLANEGVVSGRYAIGNMQLYVSNGAGLWNGFPIRLGRPSEITQIVLRSVAAPAT